VIAAGIGFHDAGVHSEAFALHKAGCHAGADHSLEHMPRRSLSWKRPWRFFEKVE